MSVRNQAVAIICFHIAFIANDISIFIDRNDGFITYDFAFIYIYSCDLSRLVSSQVIIIRLWVFYF